MKIFLDKVKKEYEAGVVKMLELIVEVEFGMKGSVSVFVRMDVSVMIV